MSLEGYVKREVVRFDKLGKLSPRFVGLFEVLEMVGTVAYRLALPGKLIRCSCGIPCPHAP